MPHIHNNIRTPTHDKIDVRSCNRKWNVNKPLEARSSDSTQSIMLTKQRHRENERNWCDCVWLCCAIWSRDRCSSIAFPYPSNSKSIVLAPIKKKPETNGNNFHLYIFCSDHAIKKIIVVSFETGTHSNKNADFKLWIDFCSAIKIQ